MGKMSEEGRANISAGMKALWAAKKERAAKGLKASRRSKLLKTARIKTEGNSEISFEERWKNISKNFLKTVKEDVLREQQKSLRVYENVKKYEYERALHQIEKKAVESKLDQKNFINKYVKSVLDDFLRSQALTDAIMARFEVYDLSKTKPLTFGEKVKALFNGQ